MTTYLPKDMNGWMREMEKRISALTRRRVQSDAWAASPFTKQVPRWKSRLVANASLAAGTPTTLAYSSVYAQPQHSPAGQPNDFFEYSLVSNQGRVYVKVDGLYLVQCSLQFAGATGGSRKINLFRNADSQAFATGEASPSPTSGIGTRAEAAMPIALAAGDFIYPVAMSTSVAVNVTAAGSTGQGGYADSTLSIVPIGALYYTPA